MADIKITIRFDKSQRDSETLREIMNDMQAYKVSAKNKEEAVRVWNDEFERRLREAGLSDR